MKSLYKSILLAGALFGAYYFAAREFHPFEHFSPHPIEYKSILHNTSRVDSLSRTSKDSLNDQIIKYFLSAHNDSQKLK